jgi:hypothetical protein
MAEPSEGSMQSMRESRAATTMLGEASEVVKQEKKETKKKRKKVQKEAVALNKDDPPPGYENMENNGRCEGCVGDSVPCMVEIDKLIVWRTGDSGVKAVCWQCKCKRKACDFGGDGLGAKEKTRATSPVPSATSSLKRKRGAQVVVELPKMKKVKMGELEVAEWGRKIERKLEEILQAVKAGTVEQKERDRALNAWLARVLGEAPLEIVQGSSQDVAPILTLAVASWAGSSKVEEDYFQELEVEVEDARTERLLGEEILAVGSEERSDSRVKAVCWQCKCKRKACDFGGDESGAKGKAKEKTRAT